MPFFVIKQIQDQLLSEKMMRITKLINMFFFQIRKVPLSVTDIYFVLEYIWLKNKGKTEIGFIC